MNFLKKLFSKEKKEIKETIISEGAHKNCDVCFNPKIDPFSHCILNPYFKTSGEFSKAFSEFEVRLGSLQRYFEMNDYNIKYYLKTSKVLIKENKKDNDHSQEELKKFDACHFADVDYFYEMHYLSILLILFTMFENLLSDLVKDISYISKINFNNSIQKDLPYINKYILFLKNTCKLDIEISQKQWHSVNTIRKVRNNYLHNLETDISSDLQEELLKIITPKNNNKVTINDEFLSMCFELFGGIATDLEKAYWEYKKDLFKMEQ